MAINRVIQIILIILVIFAPALYLAGCAEFNIFDAPSVVLKHPLGTDSVKIGMSKSEVKSRWGDPDQINPLDPTDSWATAREEWVYVGRYTKVPLDRSYLFKTKKLTFDGNNLVHIQDGSADKSSEE